MVGKGFPRILFDSLSIIDNGLKYQKKLSNFVAASVDLPWNYKFKFE